MTTLIKHLNDFSLAMCRDNFKGRFRKKLFRKNYSNCMIFKIKNNAKRKDTKENIASIPRILYIVGLFLPCMNRAQTFS